MLCPSCDSVRFPALKCTTSSCDSNSTHSRKPSATVHGANAAPSISVINTTTAFTVSTATAQHSDTAENKSAKIIVANNNASCPVCCEDITGCKLMCNMCNYYVHEQCSNLQPETAAKLLHIIDLDGWVCQDCRSDRVHCNQTIQQLQYNLAQMAEQPSDVLHKVDTLRTNYLGWKAKATTVIADHEFCPLL